MTRASVNHGTAHPPSWPTTSVVFHTPSAYASWPPIPSTRPERSSNPPSAAKNGTCVELDVPADHVDVDLDAGLLGERLERRLHVLLRPGFSRCLKSCGGAVTSLENLRRRGARAALDELDGQDDRAVCGLALGQAQDRRAGGRAEPRLVLPEGRQRRVHVVGELDVVEPDDRDVGRDRQAGL